MQELPSPDIGAKSIQISDLQFPGNPAVGRRRFPPKCGCNRNLPRCRRRGQSKVGLSVVVIAQGFRQGIAPARLGQFADSARGQPDVELEVGIFAGEGSFPI